MPSQQGSTNFNFKAERRSLVTARLSVTADTAAPFYESLVVRTRKLIKLMQSANWLEFQFGFHAALRMLL